VVAVRERVVLDREALMGFLSACDPAVRAFLKGLVVTFTRDRGAQAHKRDAKDKTKKGRRETIYTGKTRRTTT